MKTPFIKALLILLLTIAAVPCLAQQRGTVVFTYDGNGNRIMRSFGMKKISENGQNVESENPTIDEATDSFRDMEVSIYPNPTKDIVFVSVKCGESHSVLKVKLATSTGVVLQEKELIGTTDSFDLSGQAVGIYFIELTTADETHVWKIIRY